MTRSAMAKGTTHVAISGISTDVDGHSSFDIDVGPLLADRSPAFVERMLEAAGGSSEVRISSTNNSEFLGDIRSRFGEEIDAALESARADAPALSDGEEPYEESHGLSFVLNVSDLEAFIDEGIAPGRSSNTMAPG